MPLGDVIERALAAVGVTEDALADWLGGPCGCRERKEKLNALGAWAARVLSGRSDGARDYLDRLTRRPELE